MRIPNVTHRNYAHDAVGAGGIVAGLRAACANPGTTAEFVVRMHPTYAHEHPNDPIERLVVRVGLAELGGRPTWRFAGEGGDLYGPGSTALISSAHDDQSVELAAATLTYRLARECPHHGYWIYRVLD